MTQENPEKLRESQKLDGVPCRTASEVPGHGKLIAVETSSSDWVYRTPGMNGILMVMGI